MVNLNQHKNNTNIQMQDRSSISFLDIAAST